MEKLDSRDDSKVLRLLEFVGLVSKCDMESVFWMNDNNQEHCNKDNNDFCNNKHYKIIIIVRSMWLARKPF